MAAVANTFTGTSWDNLRVNAVYAFDAANGEVTVGGIVYPKLTNAQAIALMQAWRGQLLAWKQPAAAWSQWSGAWYAAFGFRADGDKFDVAIARGAELAPDDVIANAWEAAANAAALLDSLGASPIILVLNFSYQGWRTAASTAWTQLQKERAKRKPTPKPNTKIPVPPGIDPPDVDPPDDAPQPPLPVVPSLPSPDGSTLLFVVLLAIAIAARKRKKN